MVGGTGIEPVTSAMSTQCCNCLSHEQLQNNGKQSGKQKPINIELLSQYLNHLKLRQLSAIHIQKTNELLSKFVKYIGSKTPSAELVSQYLSLYQSHKPNTIFRYYTYIRCFMKWYGNDINLYIKPPRLTPQYYSREDIDKLLHAMTIKRSHKHTIQRDVLLVEVAISTGLRRSELANLTVEDIDFENNRLYVKKGKGGKSRTIPLINILVVKLSDFCSNKKATDSIFSLCAQQITHKIRFFSQKADVGIKPHSLRHYFGTKLVERGANLRAVQELMGHSSLNTTQVYIGITSRHLEDTINLLSEDPIS